MATKKKRTKRRRQAPRKSKRGVMMGMRRGFQKTANAVVGSGEKAQQSKKSSWVGTLLTLIILAAAIGFFFYRR